MNRLDAAGTGEAGDDIPRQALLDAHGLAHSYFRRALAGSWCPAYLRQRGLEGALDPSWGTGYAPRGWRNLVHYLDRHGVAPEVALAAGLASRTANGRIIDRFRDRLVLPIQDGSGATIAFIARANPGADPARTPKWINSPNTALYQKREHLFGSTIAAPLLQAGALPVLVEGPFDAIAITHGTGGRAAGLALCGTAVASQAVVEALRQAKRGPAIVAMDGDAAGDAAALKALVALSRAGVTVDGVALPAGHDAASWLLEHGRDGVVCAARPTTSLGRDCPGLAAREGSRLPSTCWPPTWRGRRDCRVVSAGSVRRSVRQRVRARSRGRFRDVSEHEAVETMNIREHPCSAGCWGRPGAHPPRVRGAQPSRTYDLLPAGVIPAGAGSTFRGHPRVPSSSVQRSSRSSRMTP